jgi:porin
MRFSILTSLPLVLVAGLLANLAARADDTVPAAAANKASAQVATTPPPPPPGPTFWEQSSLTGNWGGLRDTLGNDGFSPFASWAGEIWGNLRGGIRSGMTQDMLLSWGFDADMQKLASVSGGAVHATFYWLQGQSPNTNVGAFNDVSENDAANMVRIFTLYWKQKFWNDQFELKVGELGIDDDNFCQVPSIGFFFNAGITAPPTLYGQTLANGDFAMPEYPLAAPGLMAHYLPANSQFEGQVGLYDGDAGPNVSHYHGLGFRTDNSVLLIGQLSWHYTLGKRAGTLQTGAFYHGGDFTNWNTGGAGRGIEGAYVTAEQVVLQSPVAGDAAPSPILTAFAYGGWAGPDDRVTADWTACTGLNWNGPLPSRPNDDAGVAVLYTGLSPAYANAPITHKGLGYGHTSETDLEFTYQAVLTPWFSVQPDLQLIFDPALSPTGATAVAVGTRAVVTF